MTHNAKIFGTKKKGSCTGTRISENRAAATLRCVTERAKQATPTQFDAAQRTARRSCTTLTHPRSLGFIKDNLVQSP
jgi:hypothetical protein